MSRLTHSTPLTSSINILVFSYCLDPDSFYFLFFGRGFNEAVNGFTDEGWSMMGNDGMDDVTILVNSSPDKLMGLNLTFANGFPAVSNAVLCAKASMLLQVSTQQWLHFSGYSICHSINMLPMRRMLKLSIPPLKMLSGCF